MPSKAWNSPSRDSLEEVILFPSVTVINADTGEESFTKGEPVTYLATVIQLSSTAAWKTNSDILNTTLSVRIFEPLNIDTNSVFNIRGKDYFITEEPFIAFQPGQRRKKTTRITVYREGK